MCCIRFCFIKVLQCSPALSRTDTFLFPPLFRPTKHSHSLRKAFLSNPRPIFLNCMQNDVTSMRHCLTSFRKKLYTTASKEPSITFCNIQKIDVSSLHYKSKTRSSQVIIGSMIHNIVSLLCRDPFLPKLSYHRNVSLAVYSPFADSLFFFLSKNKFAFV